MICKGCGAPMRYGKCEYCGRLELVGFCGNKVIYVDEEQEYIEDINYISITELQRMLS